MRPQCRVVDEVAKQDRPDENHKATPVREVPQWPGCLTALEVVAEDHRPPTFRPNPPYEVDDVAEKV